MADTFDFRKLPANTADGVETFYKNVKTQPLEFTKKVEAGDDKNKTTTSTIALSSHPTIVTALDTLNTEFNSQIKAVFTELTDKAKQIEASGDAKAAIKGHDAEYNNCIEKLADSTAQAADHLKALFNKEIAGMAQIAETNWLNSLSDKERNDIDANPEESRKKFVEKLVGELQKRQKADLDNVTSSFTEIKMKLDQRRQDLCVNAHSLYLKHRNPNVIEKITEPLFNVEGFGDFGSSLLKNQLTKGERIEHRVVSVGKGSGKVVSGMQTEGSFHHVGISFNFKGEKDGRSAGITFDWPAELKDVKPGSTLAAAKYKIQLDAWRYVFAEQMRTDPNKTHWFIDSIARSMTSNDKEYEQTVILLAESIYRVCPKAQKIFAGPVSEKTKAIIDDPVRCATKASNYTNNKESFTTQLFKKLGIQKSPDVSNKTPDIKEMDTYQYTPTAKLPERLPGAGIVPLAARPDAAAAAAAAATSDVALALKGEPEARAGKSPGLK